MTGEMVKSLTIDEIIAATGGRIISRGPDRFTGVSTDSRKIVGGELFVALRGERFDGHNFVKEALKRGAGALVEAAQNGSFTDKTVIAVDDALKGLQDLAHYVRRRKGIPVIGITGSNGKTTTKELISSILGIERRVLKSEGNLNNHIGLPLTLLRMTDVDEVAVLEMGASGPGEISRLCAIAEPDFGVFTTISPAHIEGFGDLETIRRTKLELLERASSAVVNADDLFLMEGMEKSGFRGRIVKYGLQNVSEISAGDIELLRRGSRFTLRLPDGQSASIELQLPGLFNIYNALAAAAIGYLFQMRVESIGKAMGSFSGVPMRFEIRQMNGAEVICDMYNANPASMREAVRETARVKGKRAIAVLGDMLELGKYEEEAHRQIVALLSELPIDILIAVGPLMGVAASGFTGKAYKASTAAEAGKILCSIRQEGDTILIKGSRGMGMEKALEE